MKELVNLEINVKFAIIANLSVLVSHEKYVPRHGSRKVNFFHQL